MLSLLPPIPEVPEDFYHPDLLPEEDTFRYDTRRGCSPPEETSFETVYSPAPKAMAPEPLRILYSRSTEWWDGDEEYSPFYRANDVERGLKLSHFQILRYESENKRGKVAAAKHISTGNVVCVKMFPRGNIAASTKAMHEVYAYKQIAKFPPSPFLVEAQAAFRDLSYMHIVMPLLPRTLESRIGEIIPLRQVAKIVLQVAAGLSDLHNMGIVHCNLKPSNIFLTPAGDARVADFGFSKVHTLGVAKRRLLPLGYVPEWQPFLGPEALNGRYDSMIDFWALGVTMFQVITGRLPFPTMDSLLVYVKVGRDLEQWAYKEGLTPAQAFVILGLLQPNTMRRFDGGRLAGCDYFSGVVVNCVAWKAYVRPGGPQDSGEFSCKPEYLQNSAQDKIASTHDPHLRGTTGRGGVTQDTTPSFDWVTPRA